MPSEILTKLVAWQAQMIPFLDSLSTGGTHSAPTTRHRLSAHWIPASNRPGDHSYFQALKPAAIKVVSLDPTRIREAMNYLDPSSDSLLVVRDHPLSEEHDSMAQDPVACGKRHALNWANQFKSGGRLVGIPTARVVVCGINEPDVHNVAEEQIVFAYTKAFLEALTVYGLRGLALNLSVGWPRNNDTATVKNTKPMWEIFKPLESIINSGPGKGHLLGLHEYWRNDPDESWYQAPNGEKWGWTAHRHYACELSVPILIGECGMSKKVNGAPAPGQAVGWLGNQSPQAFAEALWRYSDKCHPNVVGCMPFTTDMASADWLTMDTEKAHADILARIHAYAWPTGAWPLKKSTPPDDPTPEAWQIGDTVKALTTVNIRQAAGFAGRVVGHLLLNETATLTGGAVVVDKLVWWQTAAGWMAQAVDGTPLLAKTIRIRYPFDGTYRITQNYGENPADYARFGLKGHNGIDFACPLGTRILAADNGVVRESLNDPTGFGLYVKLAHAWGETIYAHFREQVVTAGQLVTTGQLLGYSDSTGNSTGNHLHFGLRKHPYIRTDGWQGYSDPSVYLPKMGQG